MLYLSYGVKTNVGRKRDHNEDFVAYFDPTEDQDLQRSGKLFIVADGVGGASHGERASKYAAEKVLYDYYNSSDISPGARLQQIIQDAGNQINTFAEEGERFIRMATTIVAAAIIDDNLIIANVGDSRAYLIRDNIANQISKDHSFVGEMVRDGLMTEEEARTSKQKNRITRSLGGERDVRVDVFEGIKLADGDKILLCSDGFSQYAPNEMVAQIAQNGTAEEIAGKMIAHANKQGGSDNISVILIKVSSSPLEETVTMRPSKQDLRVPPDWDKMDTDHGSDINTNGINSFVRFAGLKLHKKIAYILLLLFLVSTIFAVYVLSRWSTITPPPTSMAGTIDEPGASLGYPNQPTSIPTMNIPATNTPLHLNADILPTEANPTATQTPAPNMCRYKITDIDEQNFPNAMSTLLAQRFSITTDGWEEFEKQIAPKIRCSQIVDDNSSCKYGQGGDVSSIKTGWIIEFPLYLIDALEEKSTGMCEQHGVPVYVAPHPQNNQN